MLCRQPLQQAIWQSPLTDLPFIPKHLLNCNHASVPTLDCKTKERTAQGTTLTKPTTGKPCRTWGLDDNSLSVACTNPETQIESSDKFQQYVIGPCLQIWTTQYAFNHGEDPENTLTKSADDIRLQEGVGIISQRVKPQFQMSITHIHIRRIKSYLHFQSSFLIKCTVGGRLLSPYLVHMTFKTMIKK